MRYFNYTLLFISTEHKVSETKDLTLNQYLDRAKKRGVISKDDIIDEKQIKLLVFYFMPSPCVSGGIFIRKSFVPKSAFCAFQFGMPSTFFEGFYSF